MRGILAVLLMLAPPAFAEIGAAEDCAPAIAADAARAREEAALWYRTGGGTAARLCEAAALSAIGAHATAARLLTALGENPNRAMSVDVRAVILEDAAREWLEAGYPDLARAALDQADAVFPGTAPRLMLRARAAAADGDWPAARTALDGVLAVTPDDALALALRAAALRNAGDLAAAVADADRALTLAPELPEALFEAGAARAEAGDRAGASALWLRLIAVAPESPLAGLARRNLQALN